jgi:hypothetical protein
MARGSHFTRVAIMAEDFVKPDPDQVTFPNLPRGPSATLSCCHPPARDIKTVRLCTTTATACLSRVPGSSWHAATALDGKTAVPDSGRGISLSVAIAGRSRQLSSDTRRAHRCSLGSPARRCSPRGAEGCGKPAALFLLMWSGLKANPGLAQIAGTSTNYRAPRRTPSFGFVNQLPSGA